uniref:Secreted protein n=1 Tax=Macrostomum lignano TaxID=282301 RepID=A0A1I8F420_9PLAT
MYFSKFPHLILIGNALSRVINRTEMASSRDTSSSSSSASDRPLESTNFAIEIEPTTPMMLMMMIVVMRIVGLDTGVQFRTWTGS